MTESTAVVTGGSRGIGLQIVRKLLSQGYDVAVCSRYNTKELQALMDANEIGSVFWFKMDLSDESSVVAAAREVLSSCKNIDALINCAGIAHGGSFFLTKLEDMRSVFDVNYFHTLLFTQIIAKKMIRRKAGTIVNVLSTAAYYADKGTLAYGGSKAALLHSTKVLASELGAFGIRVNGVAPAIVDTEMGRQNDQRAQELSHQRSSIGGVIGPEDVANSVCFLLSEKASSKITGHVINIDRGLN